METADECIGLRKIGLNTWVTSLWSWNIETEISRRSIYKLGNGIWILWSEEHWLFIWGGLMTVVKYRVKWKMVSEYDGLRQPCLKILGWSQYWVGIHRVKLENDLGICDLSNEVVLISRVVLKWGFTVCFSCREMENARN